MQASIDPDKIAATERLIRPYIRHTPTITVDAGDFGLGSMPLVFKLEFLQHTGSFKPRGAFTNLLTRKAPDVGVVAASGGNHGAAVAYAAGRLGIRARVFVPEIAAPVKMRTASPGPIARSGRRPAATSSTTVRVAGTSATSTARTA